MVRLVQRYVWYAIALIATGCVGVIFTIWMGLGDPGFVVFTLSGVLCTSLLYAYRGIELFRVCQRMHSETPGEHRTVRRFAAALNIHRNADVAFTLLGIALAFLHKTLGISVWVGVSVAFLCGLLSFFDMFLHWSFVEIDRKRSKGG